MTDGPSTCRSCGATIWWAHTDTGLRIPIDPPPPGGDPDGTLIGWRADDGTIRVTHPKNAWGGLRCRAHFSTCPDADTHRRPR